MCVKRYAVFSFIGVLALIGAICASAQSNTFTYQGRLTDSGAPANGTYLMQFSLWDALSNGNQIGPTLTFDGGLDPPAVQVTNGIFAVQLDFGNPTPPFDNTPRFDGSPRWIAIAVRKVGELTYTPLSPRQPITSAPYAIKSASASIAGSASLADSATNAGTASNALQLGGVVASQYVLTTDSRMTDSRNPLAGSANYIQNGTSQQSTSNFNISGNGTAGGTLSGNIINSSTRFDIGNSRVLSIPSLENTFVGIGAGNDSSPGGDNAFFGTSAGQSISNGGFHSLFGAFAGQGITIGGGNSFFGYKAGVATSIGSGDTFVGEQTGTLNQSGSENTFLGDGAGTHNISGGQNTLLGAATDIIGDPENSIQINNSTAIGAFALVSQSNSIVLGSIKGTNNASADTSVGIGTTAPTFKLHVVDPGNRTMRVETSTIGGIVASFGGRGSFLIDSAGGSGGRLQIAENADTTIGAGLGMSGNLFVRGGVQANGSLVVVGTATVDTLGSAGSTSLCRNSSLVISTCSSSLRYKTNVAGFTPGLALVRQLSPITFNWKQGGMKDVGFGAEDVAKVNPLFVTYNDTGQVEGVKYDRLSVAFVNAFKEQQRQIEDQQQQIDRQQKEIDQLRQIMSSLVVRNHSQRRTGSKPR